MFSWICDRIFSIGSRQMFSCFIWFGKSMKQPRIQNLYYLGLDFCNLLMKVLMTYNKVLLQGFIRSTLELTFLIVWSCISTWQHGCMEPLSIWPPRCVVVCPSKFLFLWSPLQWQDCDCSPVWMEMVLYSCWVWELPGWCWILRCSGEDIAQHWLQLFRVYLCL